MTVQSQPLSRRLLRSPSRWGSTATWLIAGSAVLACAAVGPSQAASTSAVPELASQTGRSAALGTLLFTPAQRAELDRARRGMVSEEKGIPVIRLDGSLRVSAGTQRHIVNGKEWDAGSPWPGGQPLRPGQSVVADGNGPVNDLVAEGSVGQRVSLGPAHLAASAPAGLQLARSASKASTPRADPTSGRGKP